MSTDNTTDSQERRADPQGLLNALVSGPLPPVSTAGRNLASVRFDYGVGCCTCTYNVLWPHDYKAMLARRIAAALNYTSSMSIREMELRNQCR